MATHQEKAIKKWMELREQRQAASESGAPAKTKQAPKKAEKAGKVRERRWADAYLSDPDGYDDLDIAGSERVMPEGEIEWRQAKIVRSPLHEGIAASAVTKSPENEEAAPPEAIRPMAPGMEQSKGTVVEVATGLVTVATDAGRYTCTLRKSLRVEHSG